MIELSNIRLKFKRNVIDDGEIIINKSKITVLSGESGCGKTSMLMEMSLLSNNADKYFLINNRNIKDFSTSEKYSFIRNGIAVVSQKPCFVESMTVIQNVELICSLNNRKVEKEKVKRLLKLLNLKVEFNSIVAELSGGEKQRLSIICAILKDTPIIIMDEPTAYIDRENINKFIFLLKKLRDLYQKTIVIATHNKNIINISDFHYRICNNSIENFKMGKKNIKENIYYDSKNLDLFPLNEFMKHHIKINKKNYKVFRVLLSLFLIGSIITIVYTRNYSKHLNEQVKTLEKNQVLLDTHENVSFRIINDLNNIHGIDSAIPYSYFTTDNNYSVSPYISQDFFDNNISYENKNNTKIYANHAIYRENDNQSINLVFDNDTMTINVNYYLDPLFKDYTIGNDKSKVIYIPFDLYNTIINERTINRIDTTLVLIKLENDVNYNEIISSIHDMNDLYEIFNNDKREMIKNIYTIFNDYINYIVKFILFMLLGTLMILKVINLFKWRLQLTILEINGVPRKQVNNLNIKKEILETYKVYILIFFITFILLILLNLFSFSLIIKVLLLYIFVFIVNLFLTYIIMIFLEHKYETCDLIKK